MVDHPLVADNMRRYIQHNKIEESLNDGLNLVLATLPQDPFSQLAAALIDVSLWTQTDSSFFYFVQKVQRPPLFEKFVATETFLNEALQTIRIDVYISYKGQERKTFSYLVPQNQEEFEAFDYML